MKTYLLVALLISLCTQQKKTTEIVFGKVYKTTIFSETLSDNEIEYLSKSYIFNGKTKFTITLKGIRNDSTVMVAKRKILKDKIIVTEVYKKNTIRIDSTVRTMYFKQGNYVNSLYIDYENGEEMLRVKL
jgi:hypothetical protein